ncbi:MAG TPA: UPF0280 family protein [Rhodobacteraceae bacterium]|nr:UPF0280 family protein [Paracoccaceae bacterium]
MNGPNSNPLSGGRLHLQHGPIDLIIGAEGARDTAFQAAHARFQTILEELVRELPRLRRPLSAQARFKGVVAQRMAAAVQPFADVFVTPMAAVAGAVAEEILNAMLNAAPLQRAYVNNGGDIALHLSREVRPQAQFELVISGLDGHGLGTISIDSDAPVRGIATSGAGGRSFSLGIAQSVTVLARSASVADAAATLIANSVDLPGNPSITRTPANVLQPDSDLGDRLVVTGTSDLSRQEIGQALDRGHQYAQALVRNGSIVSAVIFLRGCSRVAGPLPVSALNARMAEHV